MLGFRLDDVGFGGRLRLLEVGLGKKDLLV